MTVPVHFQSGGAPKNSDLIGEHSRFYPFRGIQGAANLYGWSEPSPQFATPGSENRVTRRATGNAPRVVQRFADAIFSGIKQDSVAWCAAAVGAMLQRAGHKPSVSLAARSCEAWGVGLEAATVGAIATKKRGDSSCEGLSASSSEPTLVLCSAVIMAMRGLSRPSRARRSPRSAGRRAAAVAAQVAEDNRQEARVQVEA